MESEDNEKIIALRKQLTVLETRKRHDDVAKSQKRFQSGGPSRCGTQRHRLREHEDAVSRNPPSSYDRSPIQTDICGSSREGSEDEASLASLARVLRRKQGRGDSLGSDRREDDANSSTSRTENVTNNDQDSLIIEPESSLSSDSDTLDQETVSLFGKNVIHSSNVSPPIQKELSEIWTGILKKGIDDEERQELIKKFPHPENCVVLVPPKLNPLVISASSESVIRRDKRLSDFQGQISAAISAIGRAVTTVLKRRGGQDTSVIQQLGEAGRLLTDLFHQETLSRRELAALNLNKNLKDTLLNAPNDEWLFGNDLEERVRSHKSLTQSSKDLKDEKFPSSSSYKRSLNPRSLPRKSQGLRRGGRQQHYQQSRRDLKQYP